MPTLADFWAAACVFGCFCAKSDLIFRISVEKTGKSMDNYPLIHRNPVEKWVVIHREKREIIKKNLFCRKIKGFVRGFCRNEKDYPDGIWKNVLLSTKILWKAGKTVDNSVDNVDNCG